MRCLFILLVVFIFILLSFSLGGVFYLLLFSLSLYSPKKKNTKSAKKTVQKLSLSLSSHFPSHPYYCSTAASAAKPATAAAASAGFLIGAGSALLATDQSAPATEAAAAAAASRSTKIESGAEGEEEY